MRQQSHCRLRLQQLEGRDVPADLTVSFAAASGTLTVTGTDAANQLTVTGDAADPTHFFLSSTTDTVGGAPGPFATRSGVTSLVIRMGAGNDVVTLANSPPIRLAGGLTVDGGEGANSVSATDLTVAKGVSIRNGTNAAGRDDTQLTNLNVGGGLRVANGDGTSSTTIQRNAAGLSTVGGSVSVTNGAGSDSVNLFDLNVGGNVTVRNGRADASGSAGNTGVVNFYNTFRSLIRGSVSVSYLDGSAVTGMYDVDIGGNVAYSFGTGAGSAYFDGYQTNLPLLIRGNLSVTGAGATIVGAGRGADQIGVVVGKNFKVTTGAAADQLTLDGLTVNGTTTLSLGNGNNTVTIDDSLFAGAFNLTTGIGTDTVGLDTAAGTTLATTFNRAVKMSLGAGIDSLTLGGPADANQAVVFASSFIVRHGAEGEQAVRFGRELYPFGGDLQWLI